MALCTKFRIFSVVCPSIPSPSLFSKISPVKTRNSVPTLSFPPTISVIQTRFRIAAPALKPLRSKDDDLNWPILKRWDVPKLYPIQTRFQITPALKPLIASTRGHCFKSDSLRKSDNDLNWRILKRWDVPWDSNTIIRTSLACVLSSNFPAMAKDALKYTGVKFGELSLDEEAQILLLIYCISTTVGFAVLYSHTKWFSSLPDDIYRYDWRDPFDRKKGWLLWAGVGISTLLAVVAIPIAALYFFDGEPPQGKTDALPRYLPFIGSSKISTACMMGYGSVLAPIFEETVFRGFFMVALTKWMPTPLAVLISASVFAATHLNPAKFPIFFAIGTALGFSYAQTRNLLTPITMHAFWNSGVILFLTWLKLKGYDLMEP